MQQQIIHRQNRQVLVIRSCHYRHYFPVFSVWPVTWPVSAPLQSHLRNIFCLHNFSFYKNPLSVFPILHPAFFCIPIQRTCPCQFSYIFLHTKRTPAKICQCPYYISLKSHIHIVIAVIGTSSVQTSFPYIMMIWKQWQPADMVNTF